MRALLVTVVMPAVVVSACSPRSPHLVWEGRGDAKVVSVEEAVIPLPEVAPGVRTGPWASTEDATFQLLDAEAAERPHVHDDHDLTVVVLRGAGVLVVEDREYALQVGDVVHVGRGRAHHFHPHGTVTGLAIYTPRLERSDYREP